MPEIDARDDQHAAALSGEHRAEHLDEVADPPILDRPLAPHDHRMERTNEDRHDRVILDTERMSEEQRLELDRVLVAMQQLVGEKLAGAITLLEVRHEFAIG